MIISTIIEDLIYPPLVYAMMRALEKVFETFEIFPKWFVRFLLALHYIFPHKSCLMNKVELFKKALMKMSHDVIEISAKLYSHFLVRPSKAKGTKHNLTVLSLNCGILIMRDTSSNSLIKKYASLDSRLWHFGRVLMNCAFISKLLLSSSGS